MGFIFGSANFTRYRVDGKVPQEVMESLPDRIARCAFRPLDEDSNQEKSMGWVNIMDMFDNRMGGLPYLKEPYLALALRVDVRRVPPSALKQFCRAAEEKIKAAEGLEFLPRDRRLEIKEMIRAQLMRRAIPRSNTYDMIWRLTDGMVFFGAVQSTVCDEFAGWFFETFGLNLISVYPYALALAALAREKRSSDALETLMPFGLVGGDR